MGLQILIVVVAGLMGAHRLSNATSDSFPRKGESASFGYILSSLALIGLSVFAGLTIGITADLVLPICNWKG